MSRLDLSTKAIAEQTRVRRQLGKDFDRFKDAVGKDGCKVLFLSNGRNYPVSISLKKGRKEFLKLGQSVKETAGNIVKEENRKLAEKGIEGPWIDGEKLAVQRVDVITRESSVIAIKVRKMLFSQIIAMKDEPFEKINEAGMRKLDTNTHVFATENIGRKKSHILLIAKRGKEPGNDRMGERLLCAPQSGDEQLTFASNGMVDADMLAHPAGEINARNVLGELKEEMDIGDIRLDSVLFQGLMVDTQMFTGAFGVVNSLKVPLTVKEINDSMANAIDMGEIDELYPVEDSAKAIAKFLRDRRENCVSQLISGLIIYGYNRYGTDFLKEVTRL